MQDPDKLTKPCHVNFHMNEVLHWYLKFTNLGLYDDVILFFLKVVSWKLAADGKFFSDDVYIVLNCTKNTAV